MSLDFAPDQFRALLHETADIVDRLYTDLDAKPAYHGLPTEAVRAQFDEPLPKKGGDARALLGRVEREVFGASTLNIGPHYFAYVLSCANHAGVLGAWLATALNNTVPKWHLAAAGTELERRVIAWIAEFIGYPTDTGGVLVGGGTVANLTALAVARKRRGPASVTEAGLAGGPPLTVYTSAGAHACVEKSVELLGLGRKYLRKIATLADETVDLDTLGARITEDRAKGLHPICVVANGGTVNSGAVDPLDALADLCEREGVWFHVDAAYGGPAAGTASAAAQFAGLARADSVALDPHKWLYAPVGVGCVLVRQGEALRETFNLQAPYLAQDEHTDRTDLLEYTFELTRGMRALPVWLAFQAYGADALRAAIENNMAVVRYLGAQVDAAPDFELLTAPSLSVVCFRYRPADFRGDEAELDGLNRRLLRRLEADGRVFIAGTRVGGRVALRACCVNHRVERRHMENLVDVLRELGRAAR